MISRVDAYMRKWEARKACEDNGATYTRERRSKWRYSLAGWEAFNARWGNGPYNVKKLYKVWCALDVPRKVLDVAKMTDMTRCRVANLSKHPAFERDEHNNLRRCEA